MGEEKETLGEIAGGVLLLVVVATMRFMFSEFLTAVTIFLLAPAHPVLAALLTIFVLLPLCNQIVEADDVNDLLMKLGTRSIYALATCIPALYLAGRL